MTKGWKLLRTIIQLKLMPTSPVTVNAQMVYSMGIGVIEDDAFAAGTFPEPGASLDFPSRGWVWRDNVLVKDSTSSADPIHEINVKEDIRTQRLLGEGILVMIFNNDTFSGTSFSVDCGGFVRCLYQLP